MTNDYGWQKRRGTIALLRQTFLHRPRRGASNHRCRRPMNSTRTVAASMLSLFHTASQIARVRTLSHTAVDLVHNQPEAVPRRPALVADIVASSFSNAVTVGSRSGSDSCVSPVVLAQRIDDRYVQTDWLRANRSGSIGKNSGESQDREVQDVRRPASTIVSSSRRVSRVRIARTRLRGARSFEDGSSPFFFHVASLSVEADWRIPWRVLWFPYRYRSKR